MSLWCDSRKKCGIFTTNPSCKPHIFGVVFHFQNLRNEKAIPSTHHCGGRCFLLIHHSTRMTQIGSPAIISTRNMKAYVGEDCDKACRMTPMNDHTFHRLAGLGAGLLACFTICLGVNRTSAQEAVTVQEVLADPALFHLRQITLKGTVRRVQPLDPYEIPAGSTCYGGYLFNLEDDTM